LATLNRFIAMNISLLLMNAGEGWLAMSWLARLAIS
jgi:hypothetical protein